MKSICISRIASPILPPLQWSRWKSRRVVRWAVIVALWHIMIGAHAVIAHAEGPVEVSPLIEKVERERIAAVDHARQSAVSVFIPGGGGGGSGVVISTNGEALTNFHVTSPAGTYMQCGMADGNIYDAVIVGIDPVGDLAMIRLLGIDKKGQSKLASDFTPATQGNSRAAQSGDWCMVIGNPFLLATNLQPTVTWGLLSGVSRYQYPSGTLLEYGDCLQTDASINPGNSGGPIYDARGKLLGIVGRCSFEKRGRVNVGVGYAISINQAQNFLGQLRSGRIIDHATLGATVSTDPDGGARVTNILESSDAYRRGIRYGSEILEMDGRIVQTANDVQNVMATFPAGWRVKVRYRENGETRETLIRLRSVHLQDELLEKMAGALPPPPPREQKNPPGDADDLDDAEQRSEDEKKTKDKDTEDKDRPLTPPHKMPHGNHAAPQGEIPELASSLIVERKGFANYYFNEVLQTEFMDALRSQFPSVEPSDATGSSTSHRPIWKITGKTKQKKPQEVQILVGDDKLALVVGDRSLAAADRNDLYDAISLGSIGGIVASLDGWRQMGIEGPKEFGETYYWGTLPLGGERPLRDCVVGIDGEIEFRFLSHPQSHLLEVIEAFADKDEDPAELWIFRDPGDRTGTPSRIELRYGTEVVLAIEVDQWTVETGSETP